MRIRTAAAVLIMAALAVAVGGTTPAGAQTLDDATAPATCSTVSAPQDGPGSWCLHSYDGQGHAAQNLGTYEVHVSGRSGGTVHLAIPGAGMFGAQSGTSDRANDPLYQRDTSNDARVDVGSQSWGFDACPDGATACTLHFYAANSDQSGWLFWYVDYRANPGDTFFSEGEFAVHVIAAPYPKPDFRVATVPGHPGEYRFSASVADAVGTVSYSWVFGDHTPVVSGGPVITHTYLKPGSYDVVLAVLDDDAGRGVVHKVSVVPPALTVAVRLSRPSPLRVGTAVVATVVVKASSGAGTLTALRFRGGVIVAAHGRFSIGRSSPAVPVHGFTLKPTASRSFTVRLIPEASGGYSLSSSVFGLDAAGRATKDDAVAKGTIRSR